MATGSSRRLRNIDNTGFGPNSSVEGGRLINPDGSTNLRKRGMHVFKRVSVYHTLLKMKRAHFFFWIFFFYTSINVFFAAIYFSIGVEHLTGVDKADTVFKQVMAAFFFSSQTLTTVGYGHVAPSGMLANLVASTESLLGILSFAVVTGLIYGRFSRPRAFISFSDNLLISPFKGHRALMLRLATFKNNHLTEVEAQATVALHVPENGKTVTRFYPLPLEISKINSLALSWTLVHPMTEESPLFHHSYQDMVDQKIEVFIYIKAFDDHFSNTVQQRTSYIHNQLVNGGKFQPMFERSPDGQYTILDLDRINAFEQVPLPEQVVATEGVL